MLTVAFIRCILMEKIYCYILLFRIQVSTAEFSAMYAYY